MFLICINRRSEANASFDVFHKRIRGVEDPRGQVKPTSASEIFYPVKSRSEHHHFTWDLKVIACPYWAKPTTQSALSAISATLREACYYF